MDEIKVESTEDELRILFEALRIEDKVRDGRVNRILRYLSKYRTDSWVFEYVLANDWELAIAHQWRMPNGRLSKPDPKYIRIDNVKLHLGSKRLRGGHL